MRFMSSSITNSSTLFKCWSRVGGHVETALLALLRYLDKHL